nr:cell surface protein SprA [Bacteroidota bacterium]
LQTTPYIETTNKTYTYRSSIEPHGSLKIELNGNYTKASSTSEYMLYDKPKDKFDFHISKNETGNFNISTFTFFRSFKDKGTGVNSSLFDEFLLVRRDVAKELGDANNTNLPDQIQYVEPCGTCPNGTTTVSYVDGYQDNQQDVLVGAFYRTYTGRNIKNYDTKHVFPTVPLPNFTVSWDGLGKLSVFKKTFRTITVRHGYRSSYNIAGYTNNLLFTGDEQTARAPVSVSTGSTVLNSNFVPYYNINAITITEAFSPLIKFDFQFLKQGWSANVETKRDKSTSLNITGPQIIETKGQEYIVGLGYMYPKLKFKNLRIQGKVLESNLLIKLDVSYRRNLSIIRRVSDEISIPTGGTDILTLRSSADYQLTQNINLRLFYDWIRTKPQTSASFPTANATGGFSLRINFQ